jgi:hypothetical protein
MLQNALVKLMKYIWGYCSKDIGIWKLFPERLEHRFNTSLLASLMEGWYVIDERQGIKNLFQILEWIEILTFLSHFTSWDWTLWTLSMFAAAYKNLLRVITNVACQKRMTVIRHSFSCNEDFP